MIVSFRFVREWLRAHLTSGWVPKRNLAAAYALGDGVGKDARRARAWYRRAARAGDASALYDLGLMYLEGEGGPADFAEGRRLLIAAGEAGDAMAQKVLAELFGQGLFGCEIDMDQKAKWRELAQGQGMQL